MRRTVSLLLATSILTGCNTYNGAQKPIDDISKYADSITNSAPPTKDFTAGRHSSERIYGDTAFRLPKSHVFPADLESSNFAIRDASGKKLTLREFGTLLRKAVHADGIEVVVADNPPNTAAKGALASSLTEPLVAINREAPLDEILDDNKVPYNMEWHYDQRTRTIYLSRYVEKTFFFKALNLHDNINASITGASTNTTGNSGGTGAAAAPAANAQGQGGGGSNSQTASFSGDIDIWTEIDQKLTKTVTAPSIYSISKSTGTITVYGTPSVVHDVERYINLMNKIVTQRIAATVTAVIVDVSDGDNYGMNLNAMWNNAKSGLSAGYNGLLPSLISQPGSASIGIVNAPIGATGASLDGTQLVVAAVSTANRLVDVQSAPTIMQNTIPQALTLKTNQDIVKSVQFGTVTLGTTTTTASSTTIPYGYSVQLLTRVVGDNQIGIFAAVTETDLTNLTTFPLGTTGSLQLATTDERSVAPTTIMGSGQTLIVAGFDHYTASKQATGTGTPELPIFGGSKIGKTARLRMILCISASIMPEPGDEAQSDDSAL